MNEFLDAIRATGITPPERIEADGQLHRFPANGKKHDDAGWYVLFPDAVPAGAFGCWRSGLTQTWRANGTQSPAEQAKQREKIERAQREAEASREARRAKAAERAKEMWSAAAPATTHPYLSAKGVKSHGLRIHDGLLVVPIGESSLQFISEDGTKKYLSGGNVRGSYFKIGEPSGLVCIVEGYATGASVHECTGHAVAVAFDAGNLEPVAKAIRTKYPDLRVVIAGDSDQSETGQRKAGEAARAVGGYVAIPSATGKDWNDIHCEQGASAVKAGIDAAVENSEEWGEAESIAEKSDPLPYPVDALPGLIRDAVQEVQTFTQAPAALVACSALAVLSAAAQGLANVRRDAQLCGPVSINTLVVADSGERKTSCDEFFSRVLREWERDAAEAMALDVARAASEHSAFNAKRGGVEDAIKRAARGGKDTASLEHDLHDLMRNPPVDVLVPRLTYVDITPEALAFELSRGWPCAAMLSAEAGAILGGHAMSADTLMRNLALLNVLWDGGEIRVDRRTKESFSLRGKRLTFGVMIQEATLRDFIERARGLARGTGFLARFLVCWPQSTQGTRTYRKAPEHLPALDAFSGRIRELLSSRPAMESGELTPVDLPLSAAARDVWIKFHDDVERELGDRGELRDIRDVASKAAENVARVAGLLHMLTSGVSGEISVASVTQAGRIVAWHLAEARRLLGALDAPEAIANAIKLDSWLRIEALRTKSNLIPTRQIRQFGPYAVRQESELSAALAELASRQRARGRREGKRKFVAVNPAILEGEL